MTTFAKMGLTWILGFLTGIIIIILGQSLYAQIIDEPKINEDIEKSEIIKQEIQNDILIKENLEINNPIIITNEKLDTIIFLLYEIRQDLKK